MDPYQILGVARGSTREEVKRAFRATVWHAHPDRGGENDSFIRLCTAYNQILNELDRNPRPSVPNPARAHRNGRPSVPPDRSWNPNFVVRSGAPGNNRTTKPPDPNWKPDLVIPDEDPPVIRAPGPPDPGVARRTYVSWLRQVSAQSARGKSGRRSDWAGGFGMLIILAVMVLGLWGCWMAWTHDAEESARAAVAESIRFDPAAASGVASKGPRSERRVSPNDSNAETPRSPR